MPMAATMAVPTNWSDPWDLTYPRASSIRGPDPFQFLVELFDLFLNELPLIPKHVNRTPHLRCQIGLSVLQNACNRNLEICWLLGKDHPALAGSRYDHATYMIARETFARQRLPVDGTNTIETKQPGFGCKPKIPVRRLGNLINNTRGKAFGDFPCGVSVLASG